MIFRAVKADIDEDGNGNQRGEAVHQGEVPKTDAAGDAGHDVDRGTQAGEETGDEDDTAAIAVKEGFGLNHPLRGQDFGKPARLAQARPEFPADEVHHPVAAEDAEVSNDQHDMDVFVAQFGDDAGGDEGNVFRQRQSHAAENEGAEDGVIAVIEEKGLQERKGHDEVWRQGN